MGSKEDVPVHRILVVDAEAESRERYRDELECEGFAVATAADADEALRLVRTWGPHLAVLDVRLGRDSGLDLLRRVLQVRGSLHTILVSSSPGYRDDFTSWLADAFLDKSPDSSQLVAKVHELLLRSEAV
jgi:DNA-binding response OmpR family regulator